MDFKGSRMRGPNGSLTLQIAETRFAIKCDYAPFMDWLRKECGDFLVEGEPHARINLKITLSSNSSDKFGCLRTRGDNEDLFDALLRTSDGSVQFRDTLNSCLGRCTINKQPPDLIMHASGVVYQGRAYVFTGPSGAGKTTVYDILASNPALTMLHDEVIALSQKGDGFWAWNSPFRGRRLTNVRLGAPLGAIFYLKQAPGNTCVRLSNARAVAILPETLRPIDFDIIEDKASFLNILFNLVERVPMYEFSFRPDFSFWQCIEPILLAKTSN
jgi:hypothetical protein